MRQSFALLVLACSFVCFDASAFAGIVGQSSNIEEVFSSLAHPYDFRQDRNPSDTKIHLLIERQNSILPQGLTLDVSKPGKWLDSDDALYSYQEIKAGEAIDVYYLHFDPVGQPGTPTIIEGSMTFDRDVKGFVTTSELLLAAHSIVGLVPELTGVTYPTSNLQGIEPNINTYLTLSDDRRTVSFRLPVTVNVDTFRIVTAVPEPSTMILTVVATGVSLAGTFVRRFRQRGN